MAKPLVDDLLRQDWKRSARRTNRREQEERRERRVAHMEELTKEMAAIMRGLRRMNEKNEAYGRNEAGK